MIYDESVKHNPKSRVKWSRFRKSQGLEVSYEKKKVP